jgi:hypothetical protein
MPVDDTVMQMCRAAIHQKLGSLGDLPSELANTAVNIFYKYFELSLKWTQMKSVYLPSPHAVGLNGTSQAYDTLSDSIKNITFYYDNLKDVHELVVKVAEAKQDAEKIINMIHKLRKIDRSKNSNEYERMVETILDLMKYNIKDAWKKTPILRGIERVLRNDMVNEIPELYKLV